MQANPTNTQLLHAILNRIGNIEDDIKVMKNDITDLKKDVAILKGDVAVLKKDVTVLKVDVANLKGEVVVIKKYINNESETSEISMTNQIMELLHGYNSPSYIVEKYPLRYFYVPTSNNQVTDLDGFITVRTRQSVRVRNRTGNPRNLSEEKAFIIEVKHAFTFNLIQKKLQQFCVIIDTLRGIRERRLRFSNANSEKFNQMLDQHDLENLPSDIYFIIASNNIDTQIKLLLEHISNGTLTEQMYMVDMFNNYKSSMLYSDIQDNMYISRTVKNIFKTSQSVDEIRDIFTNQRFDRQREELAKYKDRVNEILVPYSEIKDCYTSLRGKLGIFSNGKLQLFNR
jgi:uncharacterized protein (UPF0335 family)